MRRASFFWPGFGENMRVLKWIVDRVRGRDSGQRNTHRLDAVLRVDRVERAGFPEGEIRGAAERSIATHGRAEVIGHEELFIDLHDHLPPEMIYERELLICRL